MGLSITITCGLVLFMIGYVLYRGVPNISWKLVSTSPSYLDDNIGILPDILNTLYIVICNTCNCTSAWCWCCNISDWVCHKQKIVGMIEYAAETLSGIPSIIYGLCRNAVFLSVFKLADISFSRCAYSCDHESSDIMRTTQESLKTVPQSYREGAFGLGAGKWRVIRTVVLPGCMMV